MVATGDHGDGCGQGGGEAGSDDVSGVASGGPLGGVGTVMAVAKLVLAMLVEMAPVAMSRWWRHGQW